MEHVECIVVGAGVVGLAVARALARRGREVLVLEAQSSIGTGVSSRNSGVIHAGIYYAHGSLKAQLCVPGRDLLYRFCVEHGVAHRRVGKLIVATDARQLPGLRQLAARAHANQVRDLAFLSAAEVAAMEPAVRCAGALLSPSTGIVDAHELMLALQGDAEAHGALVALGARCVGGAATGNRLRVDVGGPAPVEIDCRVLVNAAALGAQQVAGGIEGLPAHTIPRRYLAKGNYFQLVGRSPFTRLVYPLPDDAWLGVHVGLDLAGRCRFGPDIHWVDDLDYDVDESQMAAFYHSIRRYWPRLPDGALAADYAGIRPKLYPRGAPACDFLIQTREQHGVAGLVNLYGIESPGLTSSLAIGERVADLATG